MLTLKTGLPRNGKTLSTVTELAALFARWEKHPEERRPVYQFGVTGITLDARLIDVFPVGGAKGDAVPLTPNGKPACALAFDEFELPDGALIVLDECQDFYPVRGPSQKVPPHVAALNTHGHRNIDYILMTQHPKLIDNGVRRLVNKHQHYRRAFGGKSAITYEWDACSDSLDYRAAIKGLFAYPKKSFALYTSATGFTKPKFKLPAFLIVPALAVPLAIWAVPKGYSILTGAATGKGISAAAPVASAPAKLVARQELAAPAPPKAQPVGEVPQALPTRLGLAGCVATRVRCMCIDSAGFDAEVSESECRVAAVKLGGLVPYDVAPRSAGRASVTAEIGAADRGAVESSAAGFASEGFGLMARPRYAFE